MPIGLCVQPKSDHIINPMRINVGGIHFCCTEKRTHLFQPLKKSTFSKSYPHIAAFRYSIGFMVLSCVQMVHFAEHERTFTKIACIASDGVAGFAICNLCIRPHWRGSCRIRLLTAIQGLKEQPRHFGGGSNPSFFPGQDT